MASTCGRRGPTHSDWEGSHPGAGLCRPTRQEARNARTNPARTHTRTPSQPIARKPVMSAMPWLWYARAPGGAALATAANVAAAASKTSSRSALDASGVREGRSGADGDSAGPSARRTTPRHRRRVRRSSARPSRGRRLGRTSPSRRTARAPDGRRRRPREYRRLSVPCPRYHPPITRPTRTSTGLQAW